MGDRQAERGHRVTPLELFFDLVVVFAITQVTTFLSRSPTWGGLLRGALLLGALWWAWSAYAWLTNMLDPEEGGVRLAVFAAIAAMLIVSLATPGAFGRDAQAAKKLPARFRFSHFDSKEYREYGSRQGYPRCARPSKSHFSLSTWEPKAAAPYSLAFTRAF